jgi:hypothetical protein
MFIYTFDSVINTSLFTGMLGIYRKIENDRHTPPKCPNSNPTLSHTNVAPRQPQHSNISIAPLACCRK